MKKRLCLGLGLFFSSSQALLLCTRAVQVSNQKVPHSTAGLRRVPFLAKCSAPPLPLHYPVANISQRSEQTIGSLKVYWKASIPPEGRWEGDREERAAFRL